MFFVYLFVSWFVYSFYVQYLRASDIFGKCRERRRMRLVNAMRPKARKWSKVRGVTFHTFLQLGHDARFRSHSRSSRPNTRDEDERPGVEEWQLCWDFIAHAGLCLLSTCFWGCMCIAGKGWGGRQPKEQARPNLAEGGWWRSSISLDQQSAKSFIWVRKDRSWTSYFHSVLQSFDHLVLAAIRCQSWQVREIARNAKVQATHGSMEYPPNSGNGHSAALFLLKSRGESVLCIFVENLSFLMFFRPSTQRWHKVCP